MLPHLHHAVISSNINFRQYCFIFRCLAMYKVIIVWLTTCCKLLKSQTDRTIGEWRSVPTWSGFCLVRNVSLHYPGLTFWDNADNDFTFFFLLSQILAIAFPAVMADSACQPTTQAGTPATAPTVTLGTTVKHVKARPSSLSICWVSSILSLEFRSL